MGGKLSFKRVQFNRKKHRTRPLKKQKRTRIERVQFGDFPARQSVGQREMVRARTYLVPVPVPDGGGGAHDVERAVAEAGLAVGGPRRLAARNTTQALAGRGAER